jgi:hypothetical protein
MLPRDIGRYIPPSSGLAVELGVGLAQLPQLEG